MHLKKFSIELQIAEICTVTLLKSDSNTDALLAREFWNTVKPFITNIGTVLDGNIRIKPEENQNIKIKNKNKNKLGSVKTNDCIKDGSVLVEMFNNHYTNIVEETSGIAPESLGGSSLPENDKETVNKILKHYESHASVSKIKCNQNETKF